MRILSRPSIRRTAAILMAVFCCSVGAQSASSQKGAAPAPHVVDVRSLGAVGDGRNDDTAAIQAAIDYAYANHIQGIVCPSGTYITSGTIYLDAPNNLRANFASPPLFSFSLAFVGEDQGIGNGDGFGCTLRPNFNDKIAFLVGPGQHMKVSGISVIGPNNAYRGNLSKGGVGIGIAGGNGGAHHTIIENTSVGNFYTLYKINANGACCLADSNSLSNVSGSNGYYGIFIHGSQPYIDRIEEPILSTTAGIYVDSSRQVTVTGGNISATSGASTSFGISHISTLGAGFTFTGVIASPDANWPNVYNSFTFVTANFGVIPATLDSWDNGTNTATFRITPAWAQANFGSIDLKNTSAIGISGELQAVTTVYAAERVFVARGLGISLEGMHVENPNACTTLQELSNFWAGSVSTIKNVYLNYDPGFTGFSPSHSPTNAQLALFLCQQTFPFIDGTLQDPVSLEIDGGDFAQKFLSGGSAPLLFQIAPGVNVTGRRLRQISPFNIQVPASNWYAYTMLGGFGNVDTVANGAGDWDMDYFLPSGFNFAFPGNCAGQANEVPCALTFGHLAVPFHGYHPAQGQTPNLSPDLFSRVSGALGALGSYVPIDCETVYRSVGYESGALTHIHLRSASCPGYSWGQNLTNATTGCSQVTWSFKGRSAMLYLDSCSIKWMFPGLGFTLSGGDGDPGSLHYVVTGVYSFMSPQYITAVATDDNAGNPFGNPQTFGGAPLGGNPSDPNTVYSCASSCTIGQAAYSWTQY